MNNMEMDISDEEIMPLLSPHSPESLHLKNESKERVPLADVTALVTPSLATENPHTARSRMDNRKRSYEGYYIPANDTTPPDSMRLRPDVVCNQQTPGVFKYRRRLSNQPPVDYFKVYPIPVEVVRNAFQYLNKRDLCNAMQACRFFYTAGSSSDNWDFVDIHNRHIYDTKLAGLLQRKVRVCRMCDAKISAIPDVPVPRPVNPDGSLLFYHLTHLDMGRTTFARINALTAILAACNQLKGLCLEGINFGEFGTEIGAYIGQNRKLNFLDLSLTRGLTEQAISSIGTGCQVLEELNLSWCDLDKLSVKVLMEKLSPTIKKLNLSGTKDKKSIEDIDVIKLAERCSNIVELDLSDNISLEDGCIQALTNLDLYALSLNRCYCISPSMFLHFHGIPILNVFGTMTDQGLRDLTDQMCPTRVNSEILNYIAKPTIPPSVSSIWQQRTRDYY